MNDNPSATELAAIAGPGAESGIVYLVGAGPGDPGLLTLRGWSLLRTADVVLHDELIAHSLLDVVKQGAIVEYVGKRGTTPSAKQAKQSDIDALLLRYAREGHSVVRLKGGDPFLFGRGSEEAEALAKAAIPFEVVPGVCSPVAAAAYAGISLTHRALASSVTFVSGTTRSGEPFDWTHLRDVRGTICVLMGMRRLEAIVDSLIEDARRPSSEPCSVVIAGSRPDQVVVTGTLANIAERVAALSVRTPGLLIVGPVTQLRDQLRWFDNRPLFGRGVLITRAAGQTAGTEGQLLRCGARPLVAPTIAIAPPTDANRVVSAVHDLRDGQYGLVVFTSENGVSRFGDAFRAQGLDARIFGGTKIAAIGSGTARAVERLGLTADIVPNSFVGEHLAAAIVDGFSSTGRTTKVLIPRARVAREIVPQMLRAAGFVVDVVPVYETVGVPDDERNALRSLFERRSVDVVMLTSSSTAENLVEILGTDLSSLIDGVVFASIGPITTATARERGLPVAVTASKHTIDGLIRAVELHYSTH